MGLYDRDYMRADRGTRGNRKEPGPRSRFPVWVIAAAVVVILAFLARSC